MTVSASAQPSQTTTPPHPLVRVGIVLLLLYVFLVGVNGLGDGFKSLGQNLLDSFFSATSNPFVALMVGILATTLVQSSSVTTALIVGLVAAPENPLPIANAVPMIMGANIGTTVTNTIVSLAHMGRPEEFRRAFAAATCHDFFNYISVLILLPLELATGYLQHTAEWMASTIGGIGGAQYDSPIKGAIKAGIAPIKAMFGLLVESPQIQAVLLILMSAVLIFAALYLLVKVMRSAMATRMENMISRALGQSAMVAIIAGMIVTVMVQSSSITTSLLVPLAGAALLTLEQVFPITIGANIGTTITALLAALAVSGEHAQEGLTIAFVHLLFNISGTLIIYPTPAMRQIPLRAARWLAGVAVRSKRWALIYVIVLFYALPALFAFVNTLFG
jgi:solute carrier family 34 (sodium-dependent phosphate cotransporter)